MTSLPVKIAENVSHAWYSQHGTGRIDIPVGVVAALTLIGQADPNGPDLAAQIAALDGPGLLELLQDIWDRQWIADPFLVEQARPLHDWLREDHGEQEIIGARAVARAALRHGLLRVTGWRDPGQRADEDVLGPVIMELRAKDARQGLGEFHTPAPVADSMADVLLGGGPRPPGARRHRVRSRGGVPVKVSGDAADQAAEDAAAANVAGIFMAAKDDPPKPGTSYYDPCVGSGGLLRAAAQYLRSIGCDPADMVWCGTDIDPIAAAAFAVNAMVWGLGPNVLVYCGNTLAEGDLPQQAAAKRRSVLEHHARVVGIARETAAWFAALAAVEALVGAISDEHPADGSAEQSGPGPELAAAGTPEPVRVVRMSEVPDSQRPP
ncbi:N-6 DNA methylase [Actinomadura syzygii]|uniref:SAM-dependent DNA methyltransferase n=1 Tax=Actinomadura syzygii TaxID=1427538 RepID=A0A5D0TSB5_9ACTN|nr:N-6 DNA methylase [Actinomadura syzygii]TYC08603.1 SAM-dependent DNA methyltransferase [Actinomadura syzygii]